MTEFKPFTKIARLSREIFITEKIDGTNACIFISEDGTEFLTASRTQWITPENDNHGFSRWAHTNKQELLKLGKGFHFGEWWGQGINRNYGLKEKRFSLFNVSKWYDDAIRPECCHVVPILYQGMFDTNAIMQTMEDLKIHGSYASDGFMKPEGIVIYHVAGNIYFKKTFEKDAEGKGQQTLDK